MPVNLLLALRCELEKAADPDKALAMQRYMKSALPFHGVPTPLRRQLAKPLLQAHAVKSASGWRKDVLALWRGAEYREERYVAIDFTRDRRAQAFQNLQALPMYEEIIVDGAWWDYVDGVCHPLGDILRSEPKAMKTRMLAWSQSPNLWHRRAAILCQLACQHDTDLDLLYRCITPSLGFREFFLQKAIGWALRQYARTDPAEIRRYVRSHEQQLSPLSRREALKHL